MTAGPAARAGAVTSRPRPGSHPVCTPFFQLSCAENQ